VKHLCRRSNSSRACSSRSRQRESATNRLRDADHVGRHAKVFRSPAQHSFAPVLTSSKSVARRACRKASADPPEILLRHAEADVHHDRLSMIAAISFGFSRKRRSPSPDRKRRNRTLAILAFGTPAPPETGFGFLISPKSSSGGCGFTLTSAASCNRGIRLQTDDLVAPGRGASQNDCVHRGSVRCCRSGTSRRETACRSLPPAPTPCYEHAVGRALVQPPFDGLNHAGCEWPAISVPKHSVIDIFVAVKIAELTPRGFRYKDRYGS